MRPQLGLGFSSRSAAAAAPAGPTNYVTNGTFTGNDATGWSSINPVWATITGDKLVLNNASGVTRTVTYTFPVAPANGLACTVSFDVSGFVANGGGVSQSITVGGTPVAGPLITANGNYSVLATAGGGTTLNITVRNGMNLSIDNVQVVG